MWDEITYPFPNFNGYTTANTQQRTHERYLFQTVYANERIVISLAYSKSANMCAIGDINR